MRTYLFIFSFLAAALFHSGQASAQSWQWAISNSSDYAGVIESSPTTVDAAGNVFSSGSLIVAGDSVTFGPYTFQSHTYPQLFVVKADPAGNVQWVVHTDSTSAFPLALAADHEGNLYLQAQYSGHYCHIGQFTLVNGTLNSMDLIAKISPNGTVLWAQNIVGRSNYMGGGIAVDNANNVYVGGAYSAAMAFIGPFFLVNNTPTGDSADIYIAKYDTHGTPLWAKSFGGRGNDYLTSLVVTNTGGVYVGGHYYSETIVIGNDTLTDSMYNIVSPTLYKYPFFAKMDNNGNPVWARDLQKHIYLTKLQVDNEQHIDIIGDIDSSMVLGKDTLNFSGGYFNCILAQYDSTGSITWAKNILSHIGTSGRGLAVDTCGNIWIAGSCDSSICLDGQWVSRPATYYDLFFLAAFDHCGRYIPGTGLQVGSGGDDALDIALDNMGHLYVGGDYEKISMTFGTTNLPTPLTYDEFFLLARYDYGPMPCDRTPCCFAGGPVASFTDTGAGTVAFHYTGTAPYDSLRWSFGDGSTSTLGIVTHTYTATGSYHACVYVYNACGMDSLCKDVNATAGIRSVNNNYGLSIYPDPATDEFTISGTTSFPTGAKAQLYDMTGRLIKSFALTGKATRIPIDDMRKGIYQCRIMVEGEVVVMPVVIK